MLYEMEVVAEIPEADFSALTHPCPGIVLSFRPNLLAASAHRVCRGSTTFHDHHTRQCKAKTPRPQP